MSQSKWSRCTINFVGAWKYISFMLSVYICNNGFGKFRDRVFEIELVQFVRVVIMTHFRKIL